MQNQGASQQEEQQEQTRGEHKQQIRLFSFYNQETSWQDTKHRREATNKRFKTTVILHQLF